MTTAMIGKYNYYAINYNAWNDVVFTHVLVMSEEKYFSRN